MKVYMCKVWDGDLGDWVDIGVFSTTAKAMENGSLYIANACGDVSLLDWEHDATISPALEGGFFITLAAYSN